MKTKRYQFNDYRALKEIVENNGVIAFPTETVYGLGIRSDSFLAYTNIFEAKSRPDNKVLTLMLYDKNDISLYAEVDKKAQKVIDFFMPGAITVVLNKKSNTILYSENENEETIGIRIPDSKETLALLKEITIPMYVTSANISGQTASCSDVEVLKQLGGRIDAIVEGEALNKQGSTVVSIVNDQVVVLREGPITLEQIEGVYES